ncbi:hypothetical protein CHS0354_015505 [Potamilus streckersoni]|uniref:Uncharacterized protein n=1 Tax=Potamilus streckersoni TaxID=2493646 RepID=A0AAE0W4P2_9BIVA|nr:hypothetical protein CHS0354_015505 [Potamilus streckersoni]
MDGIPQQAQDLYSQTPKIDTNVSKFCRSFKTPALSPKQTNTVNQCLDDESRKSPIQLKPILSDKLSNFSRDSYKGHPLLGDDSDWMLAERIQPRSSPASPEITSCYGNSNAFRFSPHIQSDDENSCWPPFNFANVPRETSKRRLFAADPITGTDEDRRSKGPSSSINQEQYAPCACLPCRDNRVTSDIEHKKSAVDIGTESHKRKLEEDYFETPTKLQRKDWMREFGLRYLKQLKVEVNNLRMQLKKPSLEVLKPVDCTCAIMEHHFLQMAESAYRSLRRMDCSPRGFQQFKTELLQTNAVIQDSLQVLQNIKSFCDHTY